MITSTNVPKCPHCDSDIHSWKKQNPAEDTTSFLECPKCHKFLKCVIEVIYKYHTKPIDTKNDKPEQL